MKAKVEKAQKAKTSSLAGSVYLAIQTAERFGTTMIVKDNGRIEELPPAALRNRIRAKEA